MNKQEAILFATTLKSIYPRDFRGESREETIARATIIQNLFKDYPYDLVYEAFRKITNEKPEWCPNLIEIEVEARNIEKNILLKKLDIKYPEKYIYNEEDRTYYNNEKYQKELKMIENKKLRLKDLKIKKLEVKNENY